MVFVIILIVHGKHICLFTKRIKLYSVLTSYGKYINVVDNVNILIALVIISKLFFNVTQIKILIKNILSLVMFITKYIHKLRSII